MKKNPMMIRVHPDLKKAVRKLSIDIGKPVQKLKPSDLKRMRIEDEPIDFSF